MERTVIPSHEVLESIRIGQLVTCNGYRHPALLAKIASIVDTLSHRHFNFGIGAGWTEPHFPKLLYPVSSPDVSHSKEIPPCLAKGECVWQRRNVHS